MTTKYITISAALKELNKDPVKELRRRRIKGHRGQSTACPVFNYLKRRTNRKDFRVKGENCTSAMVIYDSGRLTRIPENVANFISKFDAHEHHEFELPN